MNTSKLIAALAVAYATLYGAPAEAVECDIIMNLPPPKQCANGGYAAYRAPPEDRCQGLLPEDAVCYGKNEAPPYTELRCEWVGAKFSCSAWMKTPPSKFELKYKWTATTGLNAGSSAETNQSIRGVYCSRPTSTGVVTVEVISPSNMRSSTSVFLECEMP